MAAREAAAAGIQLTYAPMVDISYDPRWGRIMETSGEDAYLCGELAAARVRGFQGNDLTSPHTIAACVKHFAGYGAVMAGKRLSRNGRISAQTSGNLSPSFSSSH